MSKPSRSDEKRSGDPKGSAPPPQTTCAPLKPRPKLFWALMLVFAIWLGALLTLYFKTVYPDRHPLQRAATKSRS
jgi:hypothetical protein